jgi:hypothetical protein
VDGAEAKVGSLEEDSLEMDEIPTRLVAASPAVMQKPRTRPQPREGLGIPSFETLDRLGRAVTARLTHGISPHVCATKRGSTGHRILPMRRRAALSLGSRPARNYSQEWPCPRSREQMQEAGLALKALLLQPARSAAHELPLAPLSRWRMRLACSRSTTISS